MRHIRLAYVASSGLQHLRKFMAAYYATSTTKPTTRTLSWFRYLQSIPTFFATSWHTRIIILDFLTRFCSPLHAIAPKERKGCWLPD
ncbi:hypothetical protein CGRA01v4_04664 [Colletotrichum graminicola]|nr:hypothetical protein CGRA01v4_04664 [Colletotrichum graminicola]